MDIEILGRQAISILKSRFELPANGLLAGGSIANTIWEIVSDNKAVINDLDIFVIDVIKEYSKDYNTIFEYKEEEGKYRERYGGMDHFIENKNYCKITEASKNENDIINLIKYESDTTDPMIIIKSFDINCTQIGYLIEDDKLYWTKDFEEFLKTGNLKLTNLKTPAHTAIRIAKKKKELNAKLDSFEFKLIQHVLNYHLVDVLRTRFKDRYFNIYNENIDLLSEYFLISRQPDIEDYINSRFNDDSKIWTLKAKSGESNRNFFDILSSIFDDENIKNIHRTDHFLFYMRNVFSKDHLTKIWKGLSYFFINNPGYIDIEPLSEDLDIMVKLSKHAPNTIENLKGYKISEQIAIVRKLLNLYKEDPIIAISILEKFRIDKDIEIDEQTKLLMELAVRKKIVNDTSRKVSKILD